MKHLKTTIAQNRSRSMRHIPSVTSGSKSLLLLLSLFLFTARSQASSVTSGIIKNGYTLSESQSADEGLQINTRQVNGLTVSKIEKSGTYYRRVDDRNEYYRVYVTVDWPESAEGVDLNGIRNELLVRLKASQASPLSQVIDRYMSAFGKKIPSTPENSSYDERFEVFFDINLKSYVSGKFISYELFYFEKNDMGSIHAADVIRSYINYDLKNNRIPGYDEVFSLSKKDMFKLVRAEITGIEDDMFNPDNLQNLSNTFLLTDTIAGFVYHDKFYDFPYMAAIPVTPVILTPYGASLLSMEPSENTDLVFPKDYFKTYPNLETVGVITKFYNIGVLNYVKSEFSFVEDHISDKLLAFLRRDYQLIGYADECDDCWDTYLFRTGNQDGPSNRNEVIDVTNLGRGWFQVHYYDMGTEATTDVRVIRENGKVLLDEVKEAEICNR